MKGGRNGERPIRTALKNRHLRHFRGREDILVIDELGLAHAQSRIDVAVFNGHLHGYEIKSQSDTLERLPRQLEIYRTALQKLTFVTATRHLDAAMSAIPDWCGLVEVTEGRRGGIEFSTHRRARINPDIDPFMMAHLLWHSEAQDLLRRQGASSSDLNAPRRHLYRALVDSMPLRELAASIKAAMASRKIWRDHQQL